MLLATTDASPLVGLVDNVMYPKWLATPRPL
jgi:hypothetical protein